MDWLKELLKNAGVEKADELEKSISKEIPKYFKPAKDFNDINEKLKTAEGEKEALLKDKENIEKEYEKFKKGSISQEDYEAKKKEIEENSKNELEAVKKDSKIEIALLNAGARNIKSVKANIDVEKVKLDGDKLIGLDDQLDALKKSDAYLFTGTKSVKQGAGTEGEGGSGEHRKAEGDDKTDEDLDNMSDEEYYAYINKK